MIFFQNYWRFKSKLSFQKKIKLSDNINFGSRASDKFFLEKIKKSKFYFEYGSGASTLVANNLNKKFVSVELDKNYYFELKKRIKNNKIKYYSIGPVGEFSYPIFKFKKKIINYIQSINVYLSKKKYPDLILVDGRFRVACCLNILLQVQKKSLKVSIILDDYKKRKNYRILDKFFKIKKIGRMAFLQTSKKKASDEILKKYLFDPR